MTWQAATSGGTLLRNASGPPPQDGIPEAAASPLLLRGSADPKPFARR